MKFFYVLLLVLLVACVPAQSSSQSGTESEDVTAPISQFSQLLGVTLTVPETQSQLVIDESILSGTLTDLQSSPKGTIELNTVQAVQLNDTPFLVVPAKVQYVSGAGGIYLFLLEQTGSTYTQQQAVNLGNRIELLSLEQKGNQIISRTVDPRMGRPPFNQTPSPNAPQPGQKVFELVEGKLTEVSQE